MARADKLNESVPPPPTDLAAARRSGSTKKTQPLVLKTYLLAYNVVSCAFWGLVLIRTIQFLVIHDKSDLLSQSRVLPTTATSKLSSLFHLGASKLSSFATRKTPLSTTTLPWPLQSVIHHLSGSYDYKGLGPLVVLTQTGALLEVIHALTGWVRSDPMTVAMQVASRIWMVWGIVETCQETHYHPLFTTMILAWSVTEVIRYSFYAFALMGIEPKVLSWLRYNTFYLLYPLGAGSEAFLMFSTLPPLRTLLPSLGAHLRRKKGVLGGMRMPIKGAWGARDIGVLVLFLGWWPALYVLFTHMMRLRRKVMSKGRTVSSNSSSTKKRQ